MDTVRGHLVRDLDAVPESRRGFYEAVPEHLQEEAGRRLADRPEAKVNLNEDTQLAAWARRRNAEKAAAFRRIQQRSRRANRGKR